MEKPPLNASDPGKPGGAFEDLRDAPRFTLLIRSAKLICNGGEFLCIVRDVSTSGVRLRIFHPIPYEEGMSLQLSTGEVFPLHLVWQRDGHAGFRFSDPIDVQGFIAESSPYPRRSVRLRLCFPVTIVADGESFEASVCDLSRQGARIETNRRLAIGQKLKLESNKLPDLHAVVCWRDSPAYGLAFNEVLTFEDLAQRAAAIQLAGEHDQVEPVEECSAGRRLA